MGEGGGKEGGGQKKATVERMVENESAKQSQISYEWSRTGCSIVGQQWIDYRTQLYARLSMLAVVLCYVGTSVEIVAVIWYCEQYCSSCCSHLLG